MRAFARGVECSGDAAVVVEEGVYKHVDVAVVFSEVRSTSTPIPLSFCLSFRSYTSVLVNCGTI
jgi:hypothetical protein